MNTSSSLPLPARLHVLAAMASLLERLDRQPRSATAEQYRSVVEQVKLLLSEATPGAELQALLNASPAAAEVYENLHYGQAGLCRSPLEPALRAELAATAAMARAAGRALS